MKITSWAAAAVSLVVPFAAQADGHEERGGPPPSVVTRINLAGAGLLQPFYMNSQKGVTSGRSGRDNSRIGFAGATGTTSGYEHGTFAFVPSLSVSKAIQGNTAALTFGIGTNIARERPNLTQNEIQIDGFSIGYENFSGPDVAWSVTATFESRDTRSQIAPLSAGADTTELRFAYVRKLTDTWGIANQTYYTFGESFVTNPGGTTISDDTEFYTQFEVVGSFGPDQLGFLGEGFRLHPVLGISYQEANEESLGVKETINDGSVWAKAVLQAGLRPGAFVPNYTLGIEHVYKSDRGEQLIDEDTYGIIGIGGLIVGDGGSFNISIEHRRGLNGNRRTTSLAAGITLDL